MPKYFANKNRFVPSKADQENGLQSLDSITGTLVAINIRPGNSNSGLWLIFRVKKDYGYTDVFFDAINVGESEIDRYEFFRGKAVTIRSVNESPGIETMGAESEETIRASLLKGVAAGNIQTDDLPVLLEFAKGKDIPFEKWSLFKEKIKNEGLEKTKEDIAKGAEAIRIAIEQEKKQLSRLKELRQEVNAEMESVLGEVYSALVFLQGEDSLEGSRVKLASAYRSGNLIPIGDGHIALMDAFEKFKTKKGVYVVCEDKIHRIHDAYVENGGRAFLLGTSKEFLRTKPDEVKKLIDKFLTFFSIRDSNSSH